MRTLILAAPFLLAAGPLYGGRPLAKVSVRSFSERELAGLIKTHVKNHDRRVSLRRADGSAVSVLPRDKDAPKLADLPRAALVGLYTVVQLKEPGDREFDLLVDVPDGTAAVTVWLDGDDLLVQPGGLVTPPPPLDAATFAERWPDHPLVEEGAAWTPEVLAVLDLSLSKLSEADRATVAGVALVRRPAPKKHVGSSSGLPDSMTGIITRSAAYSETDEDGRRVEIYNHGARSTTHFIGSTSTPYPGSCWPVVHELGHAVAAAEGVEDGLTPLARAFEQARAGDPGPTPYADASPEEGFAEAFALYHLDPEALERIQPSVLAWMAGGRQ